MHFVSQSATTRAAKRVATSRRIMRAANQLTLSAGYDGWTMDELAEAVDVSRRTLFNYYPAKIDAVLGPIPDLPQPALDVFRAQGPTGVLIEDCRVLARAMLDSEQYDPQELHLHREVISRSPRLLVEVLNRFEQVTAALVEHILEREGPELGVRRARLLVRLMVAMFDTCLHSFADEGSEAAPSDSEESFADLFDAAIDSARALLA